MALFDNVVTLPTDHDELLRGEYYANNRNFGYIAAWQHFVKKLTKNDNVVLPPLEVIDKSQSQKTTAARRR